LHHQGSSYLLSRIVNQERGDPELTNFQWPARKLFHRIGAHSFYIEYHLRDVIMATGARN
jgi:hypothetical protein